MTVFTCFLIGNEPLTVECGKRLLEAGYRIAAVSTTRGSVRAWAEEAGLAVLVAVSGSTALASRLVRRSFFITQLERRGIRLAEGPQGYLLSLIPEPHAVAVILLTGFTLYMFARERIPLETTGILVLVALVVGFYLWEYPGIKPQNFFLAQC